MERYDILVGEVRQDLGFIARVVGQAFDQSAIAAEIFAFARDLQDLDQQAEAQPGDRETWRARHSKSNPTWQGYKRPGLRKADYASGFRIQVDVIIPGANG